MKEFNWKSETVTINGVETSWANRFEEIAIAKKAIIKETAAIQEQLNTGRVWARILKGEEEAVGRIGMVREMMVEHGDPQFSVAILERKGSREQRGFLWNDKGWTRHYWHSDDLQFFTLEGSGYTIWVPRIEIDGNVDGGCHVLPENWIWFHRYKGPFMEEGKGKDIEY